MAPRGGTLAARSISSVAVASAPSQQQQQQATAVSRDHWAAPRMAVPRMAAPRKVFRRPGQDKLSSFIINLPKEPSVSSVKFDLLP